MMTAGVVLFDRRRDRAFELDHRPLDGLVRIGRGFLHDHWLQTRQAGFQRAVDVIRIGLVVVRCVRDVCFHTGDVIAKAMQRFLDHGFEVFGHALAAINMGIGLQQNLHVLLVMESGQFSVDPNVRPCI